MPHHLLPHKPEDCFQFQLHGKMHFRWSNSMSKNGDVTESEFCKHHLLHYLQILTKHLEEMRVWQTSSPGCGKKRNPLLEHWLGGSWNTKKFFSSKTLRSSGDPTTAGGWELEGLQTHSVIPWFYPWWNNFLKNLKQIVLLFCYSK